uniref:Uncharacterized protein n=1 Tax=Oryza meridionalis TaxID=40149 RepID=A0A0E0DZG0_9ORYZ
MCDNKHIHADIDHAQHGRWHAELLRHVEREADEATEHDACHGQHTATAVARHPPRNLHQHRAQLLRNDRYSLTVLSGAARSSSRSPLGTASNWNPSSPPPPQPLVVVLRVDERDCASATARLA